MRGYRSVERRVAALNRRIDGGWVTLVCHPIFGIPRWIVRVETTSSPDDVPNLASEVGSPQDALTTAERFLDRHPNVTTVDQLRALDNGSSQDGNQ